MIRQPCLKDNVSPAIWRPAVGESAAVASAGSAAATGTTSGKRHLCIYSFIFLFANTSTLKFYLALNFGFNRVFPKLCLLPKNYQD